LDWLTELGVKSVIICSPPSMKIVRVVSSTAAAGPMRECDMRTGTVVASSYGLTPERYAELAASRVQHDAATSLSAHVWQPNAAQMSNVDMSVSLVAGDAPRMTVSGAPGHTRFAWYTVAQVRLSSSLNVTMPSGCTSPRATVRKRPGCALYSARCGSFMTRWSGSMITYPTGTPRHAVRGFAGGGIGYRAL